MGEILPVGRRACSSVVALSILHATPGDGASNDEAEQMLMKTPLLLATVGALALSGCMSDQSYNPNDPNANARTGAITGAAIPVSRRA